MRDARRQEAQVRASLKVVGADATGAATKDTAPVAAVAAYMTAAAAVAADCRDGQSIQRTARFPACAPAVASPTTAAAAGSDIPLAMTLAGVAVLEVVGAEKVTGAAARGGSLVAADDVLN